MRRHMASAATRERFPWAQNPLASLWLCKVFSQAQQMPFSGEQGDMGGVLVRDVDDREAWALQAVDNSDAEAQRNLQTGALESTRRTVSKGASSIASLRSAQR